MTLCTNHIGAKSYIGLADFNKINMVVVNVVSANENKKAKVPAYLLSLNAGLALSKEHQDLWQKSLYTSSAQLRSNHSEEDLNGHQLLSVVNFPRKQIGPNMSDCLVTGVQKTGLTPDQKRLTTVFVQPTQIVEPGSVVSLDIEDKILQTNPRDLSWEEFEKADLRIGTILHQEIQKVASSALNLLLQIDFGGEKLVSSFAKVCSDFSTDKIIGKQVLALTNLTPEDLQKNFGPEVESVVLTVGGKAFLEPAKPVENGFKLA